MQQVQSPIIPVVGELIRAHPGTISLGQGVVHYGPPAEAIDGIKRFLNTPNHHKYQAVQGIPELLDAIRIKLARDNNIALTDEQRVIVTAGGNMAFLNAVMAIADPGDEIIIQRPFYFNHEMAIAMTNCVPISVDTDEHFQLRPEAIAAAITERTRAVVTISPNNPSGVVHHESALREVNALCKQRGIYHICDEAYEYFTYPTHGDTDAKPHFAAGSITDADAHTISIFSLSKTYGFASWRIGYMVIPLHLETAIKKVQDTNLICPPVICQHAAAGALQSEANGGAERKAHLETMTEVHSMVRETLQQLGDRVDVPDADGAFYYLLTLDTKQNDMVIVEQLIREHGVAAIPGQTFGIDDACCLRIAYGALEKDTVAEGIGRLVEGLKAIIRP